MSKEKACVRARGAALCPDFAAQDRGIRRFIGRKFQEISPGQHGWTPTGESEEHAKCREIAHAIADGDLHAGDLETAAWASALTKKTVKFDPSFGDADGSPTASASAEELSQ